MDVRAARNKNPALFAKSILIYLQIHFHAVDNFMCFLLAYFFVVACHFFFRIRGGCGEIYCGLMNVMKKSYCRNAPRKLLNNLHVFHNGQTFLVVLFSSCIRSIWSALSSVPQPNR